MKDYNNLTRLFSVVQYHYSVFFKKMRAYPPLVFWILYLFISYQQVPSNIVQSYSASSMFLFFVMVWLSYTFFSDFDDVSEGLLLLQINNRFLHVAGKIIFLAVVCFFASAAGVVYPFILDMISRVIGSPFYPIGIRFSDFFGGLFLHFIVGTIGVSLAYLFHPIISGRRSNNAALVLALIIFAMLGVTKNQVFDMQGMISYVLLIFPPIYEILSMFTRAEVFTAWDLGVAAIFGGIYFLVAVVLGFFWYDWREYGPLAAIVGESVSLPVTTEESEPLPEVKEDSEKLSATTEDSELQAVTTEDAESVSETVVDSESSPE